MVTIRAKGAVYVIYTTFISVFCLGLLCSDIYGLIYAFSTRSLLKVLIMVTSTIIVLALNIIQAKNIICYKMVIREDGLYLAANRDLFLERQKNINFVYDGIKAIQYKKMLRPDLIEKGMFYFSAIYVYREEDFCEKRKNEEYLLTMWFSKKQVKKIMDMIALYAEKQNGYSVEILPDDIM